MKNPTVSATADVATVFAEPALIAAAILGDAMRLARGSGCPGCVGFLAPVDDPRSVIRP